ncbi:MAG: zonular occludens toxin domain-containing protein [Methylococcales bacterium]|nr:zonular occludens toxin domain-containing protein [Methylococcales bacterium]
MIRLFTGGPGTGKTAFMLDELIKFRKNEPNREVYIHGVRNLRGFAHEVIYCKSQLCDICRSVYPVGEIPEHVKLVENWHQWKEPGALIVVDEVQRIWRPRASGGAPPDSVSALETHRHYGVDFWLISQGPHLFDNFIRLLIGSHVHLVARWSGRMQYEWPECKQDVQSRSDAVTRPYTLPKHVFHMYDSAEVHTVQNKRKPLSLYATIAALCFAVVLVGFVVYRIRQRITSPSIIEPAGEGGALAPRASAGSISGIASTANNAQTKTKRIDFEPRIKARLETAPAYDELLKVQSVPFPQQCLAWTTEAGKYCRCLTDQGTPYPMPYNICFAYARGEVYNPYIKPAEPYKKPDSKADKSIQVASSQSKS